MLYYEDEYVQLHYGEYQDILPTLERVDVVMCDPPYSDHVHGAARSSRMVSSNDRGGKYGSDTRRNVDLGFESLQPEDRMFLAEQFARLAKRWVLVFSDVESDVLWRNDLTANGLDYVRTGAWVKLGSTPQFSGDRPATGFEAITIAHPKGRKRWNGGGRHGVWKYEPVWEVPIVLNRSGKDPRLHTTQKPLPLMRALIDDFTEPGEVVLDATAGSGTTGHAAKAAGRRAILIERRADYCQKIADRIANVVPDVVIPEPQPDWQQAFDFSALDGGDAA